MHGCWRARAAAAPCFSWGLSFTTQALLCPGLNPTRHGGRGQAAECLEKTAETMRLLAREGGGRFVLLTGAVMRGLAHELLGLRYGKKNRHLLASTVHYSAARRGCHAGPRP